VLTKYDIDRKFADAVLKDSAPTPLHALSEGATSGAHPESRGTHRHGPWCGSAYREGDEDEVTVTSEDKPRDLQDREDPEVEKGGKWKKLVQELLRTAAQPVSEQQCEDGVSERPVHDPVVPFEDRPEDELTSMPFLSTAPVKDPATGKSYDFLNSVRPVTGPQDIGPGGLFTKARMEAEPGASEACEGQSEALPGPGTFPTPGSVSPERFRRGPASEGHAANASAYDPPRSASLPGTPGGPARLTRASAEVLESPTPNHMKGFTSRLPGED
jgi:hypothetical protein